MSGTMTTEDNAKRAKILYNKILKQAAEIERLRLILSKIENLIDDM
jgi:hypothetical protein